MTEMQLRLRAEDSVCNKDADKDEDVYDADIYLCEIPTDQCNFESIAYKELMKG